MSIFESEAYSSAVVIIGGIGRRRAEAATGHAIETLSPEAIVSTGFAGAVQPGLRTGDLLVFSEVLTVEDGSDEPSNERAVQRYVHQEKDTQQALVNELKSRSLRCFEASCLTVSKVVSTVNDKRRIAAGTSVSAVDMESFWVLNAAAKYGVPAFAVRAVLDVADQALPQLVTRNVDTVPPGWRRVIGYLLSRPWETPELIRLARQAKIARASLAELLDAIAIRGESLIPATGKIAL